MERVEGIGGFFFRAEDPQGLSRWYDEHLGVTPPPMASDAEVWTQREGPTVFVGVGRDDTITPIGLSGWGINFRVRDLDAMVEQLRAAGIDVDVDESRYPIGRFAQLHDPEGNAVQLWQPS